MFAPMSSGGSDDVWQGQDESGSLKPGRFRAYLPDQLVTAKTPPSNEAIPFRRDHTLDIARKDRKRKTKPTKGKARARGTAFSDIGSGSDGGNDSASSAGFGARFAVGLRLGRKPLPNKRANDDSIRRNQFYDRYQPIRDFQSIYQTNSLDPMHSTILDRQTGSGAVGQSKPPLLQLSPSIAKDRFERERDWERDMNGSWAMDLIRPSRETVQVWLDSWWKRWFALAGLPSLVVWFWCAVPFPKTDPYDPNLPWCNPGEDGRGEDPNNPPWCYPRNSTTNASTPSYSSSKALLSHMPTVAGLVWSAASKVSRLTFSNQPSQSPSVTSLPNPASDPEHLTVDANFWFFLIFYYGVYVAVALVYITQLFSLYRLNWWPAAVGAKTSYTFFWVGSLVTGWLLHQWDPLDTENTRRKRQQDRRGDSFYAVNPEVGSSDNSSSDLLALSPFAFSSWARSWPWPLTGWGNSSHQDSGHTGPGGYIDESDIQWQRKTLWVGLAFATMAMPAVVCFIGLRRNGRQTYRHSLTDHQKTFLERQLSRRIPASYIRFLWFMTAFGLSLLALVAGQGYASVYLSTLPHTGLDGVAYISFWTLTVNGLALVSHWILETKVRSRALLFVFKYYYFLVYFIFYRNLFARLRSFDQFAMVQLLSSFWVCIWYPFSMSGICHRVVQYFNPEPKSWEEYVESVGLAFYLRNLAQNTTMLAFLGWVSILHFGSNQQLYPFFAYDNKHDPYNYQLTMLGSLAIWASELASSFVARQICYIAFEVDVTNLGLDEMREFPEVLTTIGWGAIHTLMDMLLFLIKLNFR